MKTVRLVNHDTLETDVVELPVFVYDERSKTYEMYDGVNHILLWADGDNCIQCEVERRCAENDVIELMFNYEIVPKEVFMTVYDKFKQWTNSVMDGTTWKN